MEVGFPDVEHFCKELENKYRATVTGGKGTDSPKWQSVRLCMKLKMIDERKLNSQLESKKYHMRKEIEEEFGKNNRKGRNIIKNLRKEAGRVKADAMKKYETPKKKV